MNKILVTLLVGIGIGILVAPAKGSETIEKLRDRLREWKDALETREDDPETEISDRSERLAN